MHSCTLSKHVENIYGFQFNFIHCLVIHREKVHPHTLSITPNDENLSGHTAMSIKYSQKTHQRPQQKLNRKVDIDDDVKNRKKIVRQRYLQTIHSVWYPVKSSQVKSSYIFIMHWIHLWVVVCERKRKQMVSKFSGQNEKKRNKLGAADSSSMKIQRRWWRKIMNFNYSLARKIEIVKIIQNQSKLHFDRKSFLGFLNNNKKEKHEWKKNTVHTNIDSAQTTLPHTYYIMICEN